jgi:hypothetical protein
MMAGGDTIKFLSEGSIKKQSQQEKRKKYQLTERNQNGKIDDVPQGRQGP